MSEITLCMDHVYKKFRKGEVFDSLRDLIPALSGRMFRRQELSENDKREFWALRDVSFEVKRGEAFGIIGGNGAGKSTILKILSRIMKPTKGSILVHGRLSALIEVSAGFHQDLTGRENIILNGTILGMTRREIQAKMDKIIDFSGLEDFIDTPVKRYSTGMYARLGFSVAAHVDPEVLLVDEVLSVGDTLFQRKCIEHMKNAIHNGTTVLFVSHNLKTVADICSSCLLLDRGRAVTVGPVLEVISHYLTRLGEHRTADETRPVVVSKVTVRDSTGPCNRFQSGQKAWIDIEIKARKRCSKFAVILYLLDESHSELFATSTERLGHGSISLNPGDIVNCTFELELNLGRGIFYPSVNLYRYDNQRWFDSWEAAETISVWCEEDITGSVNCFPKVVRQEIRPQGLPEPDNEAANDSEDGNTASTARRGR
jgi:ABC-type polysaccharide/polyol phosphate transport system ATPase subunit